MQLSRQDLMRLVTQASTVSERCSAAYTADTAANSAALIETRLRRWQQLSTKGNLTQFQQRLQWDRLQEHTIRQALGPVRLVHTHTLPTWGHILHEVVQDATTLAGSPTTDRCLDVDNPVPFADLLLPFLRVARAHVQKRIDPNIAGLSVAAQMALEGNLFTRLSTLASPALHLEFALFRTLRRQGLARWLPQQAAGGSQEIYLAFVRHFFTAGLGAFLQEYAVLARLLATTVQFWIENTTEFVTRLATDRPAMSQRFADGRRLGAVEAIQPGLSDPHRQGRTVLALRFAEGVQLVYKPRSVGMERAFFQLLAWLNGRGTPLPFKVLQVLDCREYGWVEYVEPAPCNSDEAVQRYYQRAGMLLAVIHLLQGTDCHSENVLACGEYPVVVDLETLFFPRLRLQLQGEGVRVHADIAMLLDHSVLYTGLLPLWGLAPDGRVYDTGGLSGIGEQANIVFRMACWSHVNTDDMALHYEAVQGMPPRNAPSQQGVVLSPEQYREDIVTGFTQMYRCLLRCQTALLAPDGPLESFRQQPARFLFRDTKIYAMALQKTLQPQYLRDGVDWSLELEVLARAILSQDNQDLAGPLLRAELQALYHMDIPYFTVRADSAALSLAPDDVIEQCFHEPGFERVQSMLRNLSEADLARQIEFIRMTLYARYSRFVGVMQQESAPRSTTPTEAQQMPLTAEELLAQATTIAADLQTRAIRAADGSVTWIGFTYISAGQREPVRPLDNGFYEGCSGVALFLAALASITGENACGELARDSLRHLSQWLRNPTLRHTLAQEVGLGTGTGLGGMVYSLTRVGTFLHDPALLEDAGRAAQAITPELIAGDTVLDVLGGTAGALLGLLALYRLSAEADILERAVLCGQHLCDHLVPTPTGHRAWLTLEGQSGTGLAHGAAGIAYSLLRLYDTSGDSAFLHAAQAGMAFERSVFVPAEGNWPITGEPEAVLLTKWCYGAPGIGLARLGGLHVQDDPEIRQEIAVALHTTHTYDLTGIDQLCCGNMGRVDVLLEAGQRLAQPLWWQAAQQQAASIVQRARHDGRFHLFEELPVGLTHPGFFQGTAGIGYALLRLAYPERLPCVLLWE